MTTGTTSRPALAGSASGSAGVSFSSWRGDGLRSASILCVAESLDDQADLVGLVRRTGQTATAASSMEEALASLQVRRHAFCLLLLDGTRTPIRIARAIRAQHPSTAVIAVVDQHRTEQLTEALRAGVFDVALRPLSERDLEALLSNAHQQAALATTGAMPPVDVTPWGVFGTSPAMRDVMALARMAATKRCGVIVCGERGTGHEMVARAIHAFGAGREAPFVAFDCASRTAQEIEGGLFGSGRRRRAAAVNGGNGDPGRGAGVWARAAGGTLFLDHATEMPRHLQGRLLRLMEEDASVRVVAGAEMPLAALDDGALEPSLRERLGVIEIELPALRHRREDIPALAVHFIKEICRAEGQPPKTLTRGALTLLSALAWRGNARELRSLLERLVALVPQGIIRLEDVLAHTRVDTSIVPLGAQATLREARARFERDYIAAVVRQHHGRMTEAASALGIQRTNLYRKMRRLRLDYR
ncbi:MAG: sigma-54-dependent transcriptional regulator [Vicinamibacterales bacterium]